jgi:hypothetical protein
MSNSFWDLPISTIEKALDIRRKIEALQASLSEIYGGAKKTVSTKGVDRRKGKRSAAARAKMAAAQKARWAKKRGESAAAPAPAAVKTRKKRRKMSAEARARIAAAQRARWAKQKQAA